MNRESGRSTLFRVGFSDPERARVHLAQLGEAASPLMAMLASTADPDLALASLVITALLLGTWRGLRQGTLLVPEQVAVLQPVGGTAGV